MITQFWSTITEHYGIVDFLSYFINLANLIASAVFIAGSIALARGRQPGNVAVAVRGASVVYMVFVGIVFNLLLRNADLGELQPWVNTVHHLVMPIAVLVDWLLWPPRRRIALSTPFCCPVVGNLRHRADPTAPLSG